MPLWNEARQERVRKRVFKIKVILELVCHILKIGGVAIGGIGLAFFLISVFTYAPTSGYITLVVWGFGMFLFGYILRKVVAVLYGEDVESV